MNTTPLVSLALAGALCAQGATFSTYGAGCKGNGAADLAVAVPAGHATNEGKAALAAPFSGSSRFQQVVALGDLGKSSVITALSLRQDSGAASTARSVDIEILLGHTTASPDAPSPTFASNVSGPQTTVLARQLYALPALASKSYPAPFTPRIELEQPFKFDGVRNLLLEVRVYSGIAPTSYTLDAADTAGDGVGSVVANQAGATTGAVSTKGLVLLCHGYVPGGAVPAIDGTPPVLGNKWSVSLRQALPGAFDLLFLGASAKSWNGLVLPYDLALAGALGCTVLAAGDLAFKSQVTATGEDLFSATIPNQSWLLGASLFAQWIVFDKQSNALGVALSSGGWGVVGN